MKTSESNHREQAAHHKTIFSGWKTLCNIAGMASVFIVFIILLDIILSFVPAAVTPEPGKGTVTEWFKVFQYNGFFGLRGLGLLNIINGVLMVPVFLALNIGLRHKNKTWAALSLILYLTGVIIYIANNAGFAMLNLSDQYLYSTSEEQKAVLISAGQAMLVQGEDFTPGSFPGFFFISISEIMMVLLMLKSRLFSMFASLAGFIGFTLLFLFTIWSTFIPVFYNVAMMIAIVGGLFSLVWYILVSRRLFQLGATSNQQPTS